MLNSLSILKLIDWTTDFDSVSCSYTDICGHKHLFVLGLMISMCLPIGNYQTSPKWTYSFTLLPAKFENFSCFSSLPTQGFICPKCKQFWLVCNVFWFSKQFRVFLISWKLFLDHFKGGQSGLNTSKSFLDPKELMELLKSRDYER